MFSGVPYSPAFFGGPVPFPFLQDPLLIARLLGSTLIGGGLGILTEKLIQKFYEEESLNQLEPNFINVIKANVLRALSISGAAYGINVASAIVNPVISHLVTIMNLPSQLYWHLEESLTFKSGSKKTRKLLRDALKCPSFMLQES